MGFQEVKKMNETERKKQLRIYAGQLAERMGLKVDMAKIKDADVLAAVIYLRSMWEGLEIPFN